ncbi:unnamed protein product, partial [Effrenium voratum]
ALADSLTSVLLNDSFIQWSQMRLAAIAAKFVSLFNESGCSNFLDNHLAGPTLRPVFQRAGTFFRCLCNLLQADDSLCLTEKEVVYFVNYKGTEPFERAVKALITLPEPDGINRTELKATSREWLMACASDVIRTAATLDSAKQQRDTLLEQLGKLDPQSLRHGCCSILREVLEALPALKPKLREGMVEGLQKRFLVLLRDVANSVLESSSPQISSEDLEVLLTALRKFSDRPGLLDKSAKLTEWASKHNSAMAINKLESLIQGYNEQCSKCDAHASTINLDVKLLQQLLDRCPASLPETVTEMLKVCAHRLLEKATYQVLGTDDDLNTKMSLLTALRKVLPITGHKYGDFLVKLLDFLKAAVGAQIGLQKLELLGTQTADRMKKDNKKGLLFQLCKQQRSLEETSRWLNEKTHEQAGTDDSFDASIFTAGLHHRIEQHFLISNFFDPVQDYFNLSAHSYEQDMARLSADLDGKFKHHKAGQESSWKHGLSDDADIKDVLGAAKKTLSQLKGGSLKKDLDE